jgi:hypothetical protein
LETPLKFHGQLRSCGERIADCIIDDGIPEVFDELDTLLNRKLPKFGEGLGRVFHRGIVPQRQSAGKSLRFHGCNEG